MSRTEHRQLNRKAVQQERRKFAQDLRAWHLKEGLTLQEVGKRVGVSGKLIHSLEAGRSAPSFSTVVVICREMGTVVPSFLKAVA